MHVIVCTYIHVHVLFRTRVVQGVLDDVLDLVKCLASCPCFRVLSQLVHL